MTVHQHIQKLQQKASKYLRLFLRTNRKIEKAVLRALSENGNEEQDMFFDDERRLVRWSHGAMVLSKNQYRFIKLLWESEDKTADIEVIEDALWQPDKRRHGGFIDKHTLQAHITHTRTSIANASFPYRIELVTIDGTEDPETGYRGDQGYRLVETR